MNTKQLDALLKKHPRISPQNRMDKDKVKMFSKSKGTPTIEITEETMPLYIMGANLEIETPFNKRSVHFMATILHLKKTNKLEIRGRIRRENGEKQEMPPLKEVYTIKEINKAKSKIKSLYNSILEGAPPLIEMKELEPPFELNFKINETSDNIIQQMNDSNQFDIGVAKK